MKVLDKKSSTINSSGVGNSIYEPREDSELLEKYVRKLAWGRVLDMGTGSGAQIRGLLSKRGVKRIIGVDIDGKVVDYCKKNIKNKKTDFFVSDLFSFFEDKTNKFETIIFNPPYLPQDRGIEDRAIYGGRKGYEVLERFLGSANNFLAEKGIILVIFSSLTNKKKVEEIIEKNLLKFEELEKKQLFFEELFVYKIVKSKVLRELNRRRVRGLRYWAKGKRGVVYIGEYKGQRIIVKIKRRESLAKERIKNEVKYLKRLNKKKIGPRMLFYGKDYLGEEFVEGEFILDWIERNKRSKKEKREKVKRVIVRILEQCFEMDKLGINKEEMHRPVKHIIVNKRGEPVLIDFERCYQTKKPHNVTQWGAFLERVGAAEKERMRRVLGEYKEKRTKENLIKIIKRIHY